MPNPSRAVPAIALLLLALSLGACANLGTSGYSLSERECMARVMYFESNRSSEDGMLAVGTVVMNRVQSARYPKSICGVVGQPQQFADGALSKPVSGAAYARAQKVADTVFAGDRHSGVGAAMFFHTAGYRFPYRNMYYVAAAGGNVFYEKRDPGTFSPVNPATLVAQAETRKPKAERVLLADASEQVPLPRFRTKQEVAEEADPKPARGPHREMASRTTEDQDEVAPAPAKRGEGAKTGERTLRSAVRAMGDEVAPRPARRERTARVGEEDEEGTRLNPSRRKDRAESTRLASADDEIPLPPTRSVKPSHPRTAALSEKPAKEIRDPEGSTRKPSAKAKVAKDRTKAIDVSDLDLPPKRR